MPGLDHNGPMGQGTMTGKKMGKCNNLGAGKNSQSDGNRQNVQSTKIAGRDSGIGLGLGRNMGSGRCRGMGRNRNTGSI